MWGGSRSQTPVSWWRGPELKDTLSGGCSQAPSSPGSPQPKWRIKEHSGQGARLGDQSSRARPSLSLGPQGPGPSHEACPVHTLTPPHGVCAPGTAQPAYSQPLCQDAVPTEVPSLPGLCRPSPFWVTPPLPCTRGPCHVTRPSSTSSPPREAQAAPTRGFRAPLQPESVTPLLSVHLVLFPPCMAGFSGQD